MSTANFDQGFDDPSDFKAQQLSALDEHLRCPICKEIFNATMILSSCSHSFCALCIRRSLSAEQICPKCRKPAYEDKLIHNYDLDNVVLSWKESRQFLLSMEEMASEPKPNTKQHQPKQTSQPETLTIDDDPTDDFMPIPNLKRTASSSSNNIPSSVTTTTTTRRSARLSSSQSDSNWEGNSSQMNSSQLSDTSSQTVNAKLESTSVVECPVCSKHMQFNVLDLHIDRCLKGDSRIPPSPTVRTSAASTSGGSSSSSSSSSFSVPMMKVSKSLKTNNKPIDLGKKPIKQVYALMKDRDLSELLRSFNLSDGGDRATKIWRHKEYINLYNANYDSQQPVSAHVLVQRLQSIENSQQMEKHNQSKRKATNPSQHKAAYADQYQSLINDVRRKKAKKDQETSKTEASKTE